VVQVHDKYADQPWWPTALDDLPAAPSRLGYQWITRRDVFTLAADKSPIGRVRLLLASYIWGTGDSAFLVGRRVRTFTRTPLVDVGARLDAARLLETDGPVAAYDSLVRGNRNHIAFLGPAFFTKYLYFAAGETPDIDPPPLILDRLVARGLSAGFDEWSLRASGWPAATYGRYLQFAAEQAAATGTPAGFELSLFQGQA